MGVNIYRDDRSGRGRVELVAEADLDAVLVDRAVAVSADRSEAREVESDAPKRIVGVNGGVTELGVAIFSPDRPIVGDGIFETAADRPADAGGRVLS